MTADINIISIIITFTSGGEWWQIINYIRQTVLDTIFYEAPIPNNSEYKIKKINNAPCKIYCSRIMNNDYPLICVGIFASYNTILYYPIIVFRLVLEILLLLNKILQHETIKTYYCTSQHNIIGRYARNIVFMRIFLRFFRSYTRNKTHTVHAFR